MLLSKINISPTYWKIANIHIKFPCPLNKNNKKFKIIDQSDDICCTITEFSYLRKSLSLKFWCFVGCSSCIAALLLCFNVIRIILHLFSNIPSLQEISKFQRNFSVYFSSPSVTWITLDCGIYFLCLLTTKHTNKDLRVS